MTKKNTTTKSAAKKTATKKNLVLIEARVFDKEGNQIDTIEVKNACQMWKQLQGWFAKYGDDVRIDVVQEDGNLFKSWIRKEQKNTKKIQCVNLVKATNRWQQIKAKKAAEAAKAKREAKNAKARARYAAKKNQANTVQTAQEATETPAEGAATAEA